MGLEVWSGGFGSLVGGILSDRDFPDVKVLKMLFRLFVVFLIVVGFRRGGFFKGGGFPNHWKKFGAAFWGMNFGMPKHQTPLADQGLACRFLEPQNVMSSWW